MMQYSCVGLDAVGTKGQPTFPTPKTTRVVQAVTNQDHSSSEHAPSSRLKPDLVYTRINRPSFVYRYH